MPFIKKTWSALYHLWYYLVVLLSILVILPFIFITSLKEDTYNNFFWWCRIWAKMVLIGMGYFWVVKRETTLEKDRPYIIIANHSSEIDIMLTLVLVKNCFVFIGKAELAKMPLFGYFYKRTNILVNRKSISSKKMVLKKAAQKLQEGIGVCIYPEGGIPDAKYMLAPFKAGAFKLAIENKIDILPVSFPDNRRHFNEFLDGGYPGKLRATLHKTVPTAHLTEKDVPKLMNDCYRILQQELSAYGHKGESNFSNEKSSFAT